MCANFTKIAREGSENEIRGFEATICGFAKPKFLKKNCCDLMGTKRLTCFALKIEDKSLRDDMVMRSLQEFDNHPESRTDLSEFKFAEEMLFNVCNIKRWQIDLNPKK